MAREVEDFSGPTKDCRAMAFFADQYTQAARFAKIFAGEEGRLATIPDVIDARLGSTIEDGGAWNQYFITQSAEYFGFTKQGTPIIVVAHGIGPMASTEGVMQAYQNRLKPKRYRDRGGTGGRISHKQFWDLEGGKFGNVEVVDFNSYVGRYEFPFIQTLSSEEALSDPLVRARLGVKSVEYLLRHEDESVQWAIKENEARARGEVEMFGLKIDKPVGSERYNIITLRDSDYPPYQYVHPNEAPLAHLLTINQLSITNLSSLHSDIDTMNSTNTVRLVGIRGKDPIDDICPSVLIDDEILARYLPRFIRPNTESTEVSPMVKITNWASTMFTEYPDQKTGVGSGDVEYLVQEFEPIEEPRRFVTKIRGYQMFFRYTLPEVMAIAPEGANAYYYRSDEIKIEGDNHTVPIQFYKVKVDTSQRVPRPEELEKDFDTLVWLAQNQ